MELSVDNNYEYNSNKRKFISYELNSNVNKQFYKLYDCYINQTNCDKILLCDNHIYFNSSINKLTMNQLLIYFNLIINNKQLLGYNISIYLHINSKGGILEHLYDFISFKNNCVYEIISIIENEANDCALILASLCNYRIIKKDAKCKLSAYNYLNSYNDNESNNNNNNNLLNYWDYFKQCENNYFEIESFYNNLFNIICNVIDSKITSTKLNQYLLKNNIWDAKKYKKLGLADEIV